ncbi:MAG: sigma-70 family RNA polymerase sigma factor [Ruminococcus sp.]|jgi:RNA polymerase sporulation-specific sigma factor|nr:sigma-70 family RNA polymerase sigma factor [Ruminococcus sp.]
MQSIENNLGLVHLCANKFRGKGIEYDDLYSAGCEGLIKAIRAFDEERGVKFSTYAVPVILGEIKRLFRDGGTVKVSRSLKELYLRISRERETFMKSSGREPLLSELAERLEVSVEQIAEAISSGQPVVSLTDSGEDGENQIDIPVDAPDEKISEHIALHQIIDGLCDEEKKLIYLRYYKNLTQSRIADIMGMTQVQVSRKEKKLLLVMRQKLLE